MRKLNVLFMPHPVAAIANPWDHDVIEAIGTRHALRVFDREQPVEPQLENIEVIVDLGGNITPQWLQLAARAGVKYLQAQTTGLDHVNVEGILASGLLLAHNPGYLSSVALAQSAMMFVLMHAHSYAEARGNFDARRQYVPTGIELQGLTLGLIGFGSSAQDLARRAKPFGLRILAIDVRPIEAEVLAEIQPDFLGGPDDVDRVVAESDYLSLHLHLTPETHHTIDARRIGLMKKNACLINVARGELVDEDALYQALLPRWREGAGLDVFAQ
ncbi:MAG: NAD(P)-dependent oxidoreductase, partial [bacterium]|nr:NAD(P)-dependent oxidoreductase [bacterium]